jgi:hypothetical protein
MLGSDREGHNKELERRRPWGSEDAGDSELGPPAMADAAVLCTCERQGRGWLVKGSAMVNMTGEGRRKDRLRRRKLCCSAIGREAESEREKEDGEGTGRRPLHLT